MSDAIALELTARANAHAFRGSPSWRRRPRTRTTRGVERRVRRFALLGRPGEPRLGVHDVQWSRVHPTAARSSSRRLFRQNLVQQGEDPSRELPDLLLLSAGVKRGAPCRIGPATDLADQCLDQLGDAPDLISIATAALNRVPE